MATGTIAQTLPALTQAATGATAPVSTSNVYADGGFVVPEFMGGLFDGFAYGGLAAVWPREILFYDGTKPADPDTGVTTQNLLARMSHSSKGLYDGSVLNVSDPDKVVLVFQPAGWQYDHFMGGTVTWFRVLGHTGNPLFDGTVGTSDADLVLNSVSLDSGTEISLTRFDLIAPLHGD